MAGKILVKTPVTTDGRNPLLDEKRQQVFKTTILEKAAQPILEKLNQKLPDHLKKIIEPIKDEKSK